MGSAVGLSPEQLVTLLGTVDSRRRPDRFALLLGVVACLHDIDQDWWLHAAAEIDGVSVKDINPELKGAAVASAIHEEKVSVARRLLTAA